jgi:hypothetical protein
LIHSVFSFGSGFSRREASTTMSAPRTHDAQSSVTVILVPRSASRRAANASRLSGRREWTRISSKAKIECSRRTFQYEVPRAPMWPSTFESARARWRAPMAVTAPVRMSVMSEASMIATGAPVCGSNRFSTASSDGRPRS